MDPVATPLDEKMAQILDAFARDLRAGVTDQNFLDAVALTLEIRARELREKKPGA